MTLTLRHEPVPCPTQNPIRASSLPAQYHMATTLRNALSFEKSFSGALDLFLSVSQFMSTWQRFPLTVQLPYTLNEQRLLHAALQARFEAIEDKLKLVQENLKYFLEIMQHKKSDALEWTVRRSYKSLAALAVSSESPVSSAHQPGVYVNPVHVHVLADALSWLRRSSY